MGMLRLSTPEFQVPEIPGARFQCPTLLTPKVMVQSSPSPTGVFTASHYASQSDSGMPTLKVIRQTGLKFFDRSWFSAGSDRPLPAAHTLAAMEQLVAIIHQLRLTAGAADASPIAHWHPELPLTPEALLPYVSEEVYEVLDALQTTEAPAANPSPLFTTVDALISYLLWGVARSAYPVMRLIEGIRARHYRARQTWGTGMLRLVVMLEAVTPTAGWCLDLVMGCPPGQLLANEDWLQSEQPILPVMQSPSAALMPDLPHRDRPAGNQVGILLEEFQQSILEEMPALQSLFSGVSVDLLQPGQPWQAGQLQLKLGFQFMDQDLTAIPLQPPPAFADLIDAELLEADPATQNLPVQDAIKGTVLSPLTRVSVVELPRQIPRPGTLIRLVDPAILKAASQSIIQPPLAQSIWRLQQLPIDRNTDQGLLPVVCEAWRAIDRATYRINSTLELWQSDWLLEELVPNLLWQITRSSYEITQLMGGIEVAALQPGQDWQQGTLRLMVALQIQSTKLQCMIDLTTGRLIHPETRRLHPETLCQLSLRSDLSEDFTFSWQSPVQAETVIRHLHHRICDFTPEIGQFMDTTPIEWLEVDQDWQPGTMKLSLNLELMPDEWKHP